MLIIPLILMAMPPDFDDQAAPIETYQVSVDDGPTPQPTPPPPPPSFGPTDLKFADGPTPQPTPPPPPPSFGPVDQIGRSK